MPLSNIECAIVTLHLFYKVLVVSSPWSVHTSKDALGLHCYIKVAIDKYIFSFCPQNFPWLILQYYIASIFQGSIQILLRITVKACLRTKFNPETGQETENALVLSHKSIYTIYRFCQGRSRSIVHTHAGTQERQVCCSDDLFRKRNFWYTKYGHLYTSPFS